VNKSKVFLFAILLCLIVSTATHAALIDKTGGLIYDDDLIITWLQDANYAATELNDTRVNAIISAVGSVAGHTLTTGDFPGYGTSSYPGYMTWWGAMAWADQLVYQGYDDWRLPSSYNQDATGPDFGYNVTGSEMGHLFYDELGGTAGASILTSSDPDLSLFSNLQPSYYWSGTEYDASTAWGFDFTYGVQGYGSGKGNGYYAWAVRPGDSAPIPEPATMLLVGTGLIGLAGIKRRFKKA